MTARNALTEVFQGVARVVCEEPSSDGRRTLLLETELGAVKARRAVSCLVEPIAGDSVLYAALTEGECFVLAVLERAAPCETTLSVEGDLRVRLPSGRLSLAAQDGIALVSGKDVDVAAPELTVHAGAAKVGLDRLTYLGTLVESVIDRLFQRARHAHRQVEERDEVRAGTIDYGARENVTLRGENTLVTAEDLVKIDAKQIIVG